MDLTRAHPYRRVCMMIKYTYLWNKHKTLSWGVIIRKAMQHPVSKRPQKQR